jgi:hypothetical protein
MVIPLWEMMNLRMHPTVMTKHTLDGVQVNVVLTTSLEDDTINHQDAGCVFWIEL